MFDAKQILDAMVGAGALGAPQSAGQQTPAAQGGLADMLNQALGGLTNGQAAQAGQQPGLGGLLGQLTAGQGSGGAAAGGLGGLLGQVLGGAQGGQQGGTAGAGASGGGLADILGQVLGGAQGGAAGAGSSGQTNTPQAGTTGGGGLSDILGQVLGGGAGAAAGGAAAGGLGGLLGSLLGGGQAGASGQNAGSSIGSSLSKVAGPQAGGILSDAISFAQTPQGAAILAGLAGLVVTKATHTVSSSAAQLGGAALIGGLTYKAMKNWQGGASPQVSSASAPAVAPPGSGFEPADLNNEGATVLINAMIAAAAADGQVDPAERARIAGTLKEAGFNPTAAAYLDQAFSNPPSVQDLANAAISPEHAAQIYEAARITIEPDSPANQAFLTNLKNALGLDANLVAHLDAAAQSARA